MNIYNWIEPGEFRYCCCGMYLSESRACKHSGKDLPEALKKHQQLTIARNAIAIERQKTLPPLYWMLCTCEECENKQTTLGNCKKCGSKNVVFDTPFERLNKYLQENK